MSGEAPVEPPVGSEPATAEQGPSERTTAGAPRRRVLVLRHGETTHNAAGIWQGQLDTDLTERGLQQAREAAAAIRKHAITRIIASDLRRARHTADAVAEVVGVPVEEEPRLREIHAGSWQGLTAGEVAERYPEQQAALARGDDIVRGGDGETVAQVVERARAATDEALAELSAGEALLVVCHGVTARALTADLVGIDQRTAWVALAGLSNCRWSELVEADRGWRMVGWNHGADA